MMPRCVLLVFLQSLTVLAQRPIIRQENGLKIAKVGNSVTLHCTSPGEKVSFFTWYQQKLGGKPEMISHRIKREKDSTVKKNFEQRFQSLGGEESDNLTITDLRLTDSATYFCGVLLFSTIEFVEGIFLHVQPSISYAQTVVQQQTQMRLWPGDSLDLSCTVDAELCPGGPSFYWFRHGVSQPAFVYPASVHCRDLASKNCTVKLKVEMVETTDSGMYYCALASCGEIIFGNGTTVEIAVLTIYHPLVFWLSLTLVLSIITTLILAITVYKLKKKTSCRLGRLAHPPCSADVDMSHEDTMHYAALSLNPNTEQQPQEDTDNACVYSSVRSQTQ